MVEKNLEKIKYTFLLPAYKATFFAEALNGIKRQSFHNYKVIVSDDCSPENLKLIFDSVVGNDSRFTYRRNEKNIGGESLVAHWNLLVDMCDTEYMIMASDDDIYEPDFLKDINVLVERYPQVDILRARARRIENEVTTCEDGDIPELLSQEEFMKYFGQKPMVLCLANYVFRTSALKVMGGFPDFPTAAKSDTATAICLSKNGIATTKDIRFSFRMSNENLSSGNGYDKNTIKTAEANIMFADWYREKYGETYPYKYAVEGVGYYLMARMPLCESIRYAIKFKKRGYYIGIKPLFTMTKNWIKIHI